MGEPPVCVFSTVDPNTRPPGTKKLVPTVLSSSRRMPPPSSTGNESKASTAVVNQAQHVSGMRIRDIPRVRMLSNVVMKFSAPSNEPTQKIAILIIQRFIPAPCPGPAGKPTALNGAYPVQPPIGPTVPPLAPPREAPIEAAMLVLPSTTIAARITRKPTSVTQNDIIFRTGNAMSSAPI